MNRVRQASTSMTEAIRGSTLVRDPKFTARVVAETRALLATEEGFALRGVHCRDMISSQNHEGVTAVPHFLDSSGAVRYRAHSRIQPDRSGVGCGFSGAVHEVHSLQRQWGRPHVLGFLFWLRTVRHGVYAVRVRRRLATREPFV